MSEAGDLVVAGRGDVEPETGCAGGDLGGAASVALDGSQCESGQDVADEAGGFTDRDEDWQILDHEAGPADSGHVGCGEYPRHAGHGHRRGCIDRTDLRSRMRAEDRCAVQHAGHLHVIDERSFAGRLFGCPIL